MVKKFMKLMNPNSKWFGLQLFIAVMTSFFAIMWIGNKIEQKYFPKDNTFTWYQSFENGHLVWKEGV